MMNRSLRFCAQEALRRMHEEVEDDEGNFFLSNTNFLFQSFSIALYFRQFN